MPQSPSSEAAASSRAVPHIDAPVDHATLLLDADERIKAVSRGMSHFFQASLQDLLGRHVSELLPRLSLLAGFKDRRYPIGEHARMRLSREQTIALRDDGTEVPVTVSLFETKDAGNVLLMLRHLHEEGDYCPMPPHRPTQTSQA